MKKSTQEQLARTTKKADTKVETKRETKAKPAAKPAGHDVGPDREQLLGMCRKAGLKVEAKTSWTKATGEKKGVAVYVAKRGPQVHLSGFSIKSPHVEQVSEAEAKRRHIGKVRGIVYLDRQTSDVLGTVFKSIIIELKA